MLVQAGLGLLNQVIGLFGDKGKAAQAENTKRIENMQRSWTDEFLVVTWFSPVWMSWFSPDRAAAYVETLNNMPEWYISLLYLITGAVFGLGKINGRK